MRGSEFFRGIAHVEVPWGARSICVPVFYYDVMSVSVQFLAPIAAVRAWLPSERMHPLRLTARHTLINVTGYCYRDSDIGPYNEVSISVPFSLDRPSPLFVGTLRKAPAVPKVYIRHLPVTTEIARDAGVEFAAYPKFIAEITFEEQGEWLTCHLAHEGASILALSCRTGPTSRIGRGRAEIYNVREGRMLRCEFMSSACEQFASRDAADVRLDLGAHPISEELRRLGIGRAVGTQFVPHVQGILTPVLESLPA